MLRTEFMIFKSNVKLCSMRCYVALPCIFFKTMSNTTIAIFGFCYIRNNQSRGKCNQPVIIGAEGGG